MGAGAMVAEEMAVDVSEMPEVSTANVNVGDWLGEDEVVLGLEEELEG